MCGIAKVKLFLPFSVYFFFQNKALLVLCTSAARMELIVIFPQYLLISPSSFTLTFLRIHFWSFWWKIILSFKILKRITVSKALKALQWKETPYEMSTTTTWTDQMVKCPPFFHEGSKGFLLPWTFHDFGFYCDITCSDSHWNLDHAQSRDYLMLLSPHNAAQHGTR